MTNTRFDSLADFNDIAARNRFAKLREQGMDEAQILAFLGRSGRDNSRTPMQWDDSANAGFSSAAPWFAVNANYPQINVARQREEADSVLNFYRALIRLRKQDPVWIEGRYQLQLAEHPHIYAYSRTLGTQRRLVLCNLSNEAQRINSQVLALGEWQLALGNYQDSGELQRLRPYETRVYQRQKNLSCI